MRNPLVFIDGDQGTTGLQVRERLAGRADIDLLTLPPAQRKHTGHRAEALNACDLALLCLPDDAAREAVAMVRRPGVRVIDASSAHRTAPGWVYGLPELAAGQAEAITAAGRVSNPGCYPTGMLALVRPLVDAGLLPRDAALVVHAVSGYSGRGRAGLLAHEGTEAAPPLQVYGLSLAHKHVTEMRQHAGLTVPPLFVPAYGHYRQGIVLTIGLQPGQLRAGAGAEAVHAALAAHHAGQAAIELLPLAESAGLAGLDPRALNGTDRLRLAVFGNPATGQVLLAAVFDNLGKGAAGAAVQNLDLMLGLSAG
jgi:N-acetyl-gamma-glutamyl-phosphate reductase